MRIYITQHWFHVDKLSQRIVKCAAIYPVYFKILKKTNFSTCSFSCYIHSFAAIIHHHALTLNRHHHLIDMYIHIETLWIIFYNFCCWIVSLSSSLTHSHTLHKHTRTYPYLKLGYKVFQSKTAIKFLFTVFYFRTVKLFQIYRIEMCSTWRIFNDMNRQEK